MKLTTRAKVRRALLHFGDFIASHCLSLWYTIPALFSIYLVINFMYACIESASWGTYFLGLIWLLLHPAITLTTGELKCRETYMSENALLIDLMEARASPKDAQSALNFHQNVLNLPDLSSSGCKDNCSLVLDWLDTQLRELDRVEAYKHVFQTDNASPARTNVYGILRASPLADGKEAIVLVTHYRTVGTNSGDYSSLAVGLALVQYLAQAKWLAKDIIFLAADDGELNGSDGYSPGTEAWLQAYHLDPVNGGMHGVLPMRAGIIRAAINLETLENSHLVDAVGIYTAGMNGQLPNLDLVNTAVRALRQHRIPTLLDRADTERGRKYAGGLATVLGFVSSLSEKYISLKWKESTRKYLMNLKGMLHFMTTLASGPSGPHANFISYNIDSITLALTQSQALHGRPLDTHDVLRSIEMVVRALSNLEEKLHQSFYFYVLPSTSTFVSVGEYIYALLLVTSPAIAHMLHLATQSTGMRVAFALTDFLLIEALCVLLVFVICNYFATPTALLQTFSSSDTSATKWIVLASVISVAQGLILLVGMPALRVITSFSGCVDMYDWRKRMTMYETQQQQKDARDSAFDAEKAGKSTQTKVSDDIPPVDIGWRAIKFMTMALLVYAHCIIGILNYPLALFGAIPMVQFARVVPFNTTTVPKSINNGLWLFISSPHVLLILLLCYCQDATTALSYAIDSFAQRTNLLTLMYTCCIYVSVHTLSLVVWFYPTAVPSEQKHKPE